MRADHFTFTPSQQRWSFGTNEDRNPADLKHRDKDDRQRWSFGTSEDRNQKALWEHALVPEQRWPFGTSEDRNRIVAPPAPM